MGSSSLLPFGRARLVAFAIAGNVLPVTIATRDATDGPIPRCSTWAR